jgi:hypothetical protein
MSRQARLLTTAALVEGTTGVAVMLAPGMVVGLLFASDLEGTGLVAARIAGMTLSAFALACWVAGRNGGSDAVAVGMFVYNLLVGAYFVFIGIGTADIGPLLWPTAVFHVAFAVLLAGALHGQIPDKGK